MTSWSFLTSHARVLLCIARDPFGFADMAPPGGVLVVLGLWGSITRSGVAGGVFWAEIILE